MTDISTFSFDSNFLRVVIRDGEPWFVAADVAAALSISRTDDAVSRLDDDEKGADSIRTPGGQQEMTLINESGLYSLILTSRKPEAKRFKKWVTAEVLPTIRKTGSYTSQYQQPTSNIFALALVESAAKTLRLPDSGILLMYQQAVKIYAPEAMPMLPVYAIDAPPSSNSGSSEATASLTDLLKEHGIKKSAASLNPVLVGAGLLSQESRPSRKQPDKEKTFWSITPAGLEYGKNVIHPSNPRETQPHWYRSKFSDLLSLLNLK